MSADEVYGLGRDAGERLVARALIPAPCYARLPYTLLSCPYVAHRPIIAAWFIRTLPAPGCGLAPRETAYLIPRP